MKKFAALAIALVLFGSIFIAPMASSKAAEYTDIESASQKSALVCKGDFDNDGFITFKDINPFARAIHYQDNPATLYRADITSDGFVDYRDINPFVAMVVRGGPVTARCIENPAAYEVSEPNAQYPGPQCKGDLNHDGIVDSQDINLFALFLRNHNEANVWYADITGNGFVDDADINPFIAILDGSAEPYCMNSLQAVQWPENSVQ